MGVFPIEPISTSAGRFAARIVLDPQQSYLNDHRPGGEPLFGTVMGIEALSSLALHLAPGMHVQAIESVENYSPFVLRAGVAPVLEGILEWDGAQQIDSLKCVLTSAGVGDARQPHIRATLRLRATLAPTLTPTLDATSLEVPFEAPRGARRVRSQEVYDLFFHGPALRVVASACWHGERLYALAAQGLPLCFAAPGLTAASPRLIELALQAAGLFEIAANRRMMIPHAIHRIERFSELDIDGESPVWAVASRGSQESRPQGLDIDIFDAQGKLHLRVSAYQTLPLPFAVDAAGPATLQRCFL